MAAAGGHWVKGSFTPAGGGGAIGESGWSREDLGTNQGISRHAYSGPDGRVEVQAKENFRTGVIDSIGVTFSPSGGGGEESKRFVAVDYEGAGGRSRMVQDYRTYMNEKYGIRSGVVT